jgi:hypothetical protein
MSADMKQGLWLALCVGCITNTANDVMIWLVPAHYRGVAVTVCWLVFLFVSGWVMGHKAYKLVHSRRALSESIAKERHALRALFAAGSMSAEEVHRREMVLDLILAGLRIRSD